MSIRTTFAEKPVITISILIVMLIAGAGGIAYQLRGSGRPIGATSAQAFYTVDDGKTWFADDAAMIPPFDKGGKQAVRAYVFRTADGKTTFVNYLERFTVEGKRAMESAKAPADTSAHPPPSQAGAIQSALMGGREIKRPGDAKWVNAGNFKEASKITAIKAPNGQTDATPVEP